MSWVFLPSKNGGYSISDTRIAAALLSMGAEQGEQQLATPHNNIPSFVLEGIDGETKKTVKIFIPGIHGEAATEKIRKYGYNLVGIYKPSGTSEVLFEILPPEGKEISILKLWIDQWFKGQLKVDPKSFAQKMTDLNVLRHNIEIMDIKDIPEELNPGGDSNG